ncbi:MAG: zinc-ribbon domain-containing protein [Lachnospiraceae bacterium]|nr:zinc-ribbon domain-containing protein [Lachnospiraceae bacterium]
MFCTNCGNQVPDGQGACNYCGTNFVDNSQQDSVYSNNYQSMQYQQPQYNTNNQQQYNPINQPQYQTATPVFKNPVEKYHITYMQDGMKWYLFLIWGYLIFEAISMLTNCFSMFKMASQFKDIRNMEEAELMSILCTITGILMIALGIYDIYTRHLLIEFKAKALTAVKIVFIAPIIWIAIFYFIIASILEVSMGQFFELMLQQESGGVLAISVVVYLAVAIGSIVYLGNRKNMFIY